MRFYYTLLFILGIHSNIKAQNVIYSKMESFSNWIHSPKFEVIGKIHGNLLVHLFDKNHYLKIYDNEMNQIKKITLGFIPKNINGIQFIGYTNFCNIIWEKTEGQSVIYEYAKINQNGELIGSVSNLDLIDFNKLQAEKIDLRNFIVTISEDKSKIALSILGIKEDTVQISSKIFNADFKILEKNTVKLGNYNEDSDVFNDFLITNSGDIVFSVSNKIRGLCVNYFQVFVKKIMSEKLYNINLPIDTMQLLNTTITIDNKNEEYLFNGFNIDTTENNIKGLFIAKIPFKEFKEDENVKKFQFIKNIPFIKIAKTFKNYSFLDFEVFMRKDGGCTIVAGKLNNFSNNYSDYRKVQFDRSYNTPANPGGEFERDRNRGYFNTLSSKEIKQLMENELNRLSNLRPIKFRSIGKIVIEPSDVILFNISKDGNLINDTSFQIPTNLEIDKQKISFIRNYFINFFTITVSNKSIDLIAFTKNLNQQSLMNEFKIFSHEGNVERKIINVRNDYYFDLLTSKQTENNELIIPFFHLNKIGFAKVF